jgi:hypothetical protein
VIFRSRGYVVALVLTSAGCGGPDAPPDVGTPSGDCASPAAAARARVTKVAADNVSCTADTDCVTVEVHASCFDACTAQVNLTGKGAVDRASTLVEAAECKVWNEMRCKLEIPPCAPPQPARCVDGACR